MIAFALLRPLIAGGAMPMPMPLVAAIVSTVLLYAVGARRDAVASFMRAGFHIGLFAFFLSFPILSPDELDPNIGDDIHWTIGWVLLLSIVGFEAAYSVRKRERGRKVNADRAPIALALSASAQRWLLAVVCIGTAAWLVTVLDYSWSANVPVAAVLLTMRAPVEGAIENASNDFGVASYVLGMGITTAGVAASLLITSLKSPSYGVKAVSWASLLLCATVGFLRGSRAVFFYSFAPLAVTCWMMFSGRRFARAFRWAWIGAASAVLIVVWGAMSAMRGADIRAYEGGWDNISPAIHVHGAFDIYSALAGIVKAFPEQIEFQYGASLVPLVLGWTPRAIWPEKPYPFSLYANIIKGETLEVRTASIAVGLPGEGYGNFGLAGACLWGALMGLACRKGDDYIGRLHGRNPLSLHLAGFGGIWAAMIVRGGVPEMFYMGLNVIAMPVLLAFILSRRARRIAPVPHPREAPRF